MSHQASAKELFDDQLWRLNNLYWIVDKNGKRVPFRMNDSQVRLYHEMWYRTVILKARQRGFTTFLDIFGLDQCIFNADYKTGIIAHTLGDAQEIFRTKVKFPYESLPESIRNTVGAESGTTTSYEFTNGSTINVSTSYRSGTVQFLHISEYGKIAAKTPDKAIEIKTGAIEAVPIDGMVAIESTAEGQSGAFFDYVETAREHVDNGDDLGKLDYKFFFEPWFYNEEYTQKKGEKVSRVMGEYFESLALQNIELTQGQVNWYIAKERTLKDNMKREYPSTPDEAFESSIDGAIYGKVMLEAKDRITSIPIETSALVHTFWDLGRNDCNAIWFMQQVGKESRFIDYYESRLVGLDHYARVLKDKGYLYGEHYLPHDVEVHELSTNTTRMETLENLGVTPLTVVPRINNINEGIEQTRSKFASCWFDKDRCAVGLKALKNYQYTWDDKFSVFRQKPLHNWASNAADAFRQFGQGYTDGSTWGGYNPATFDVSKFAARGVR